MTIYDHEANPIPGGAVSGEIATSDGTRLRFARWPALAGTPKGTVVLVQGRAEFLEKYFETVRDLQVRGFAVATFDLRGQGGSGRDARVGPAGHVGDFRDYQADLEAVMAEVVMPNCPPPYYGVGHSTGATILIGSAPAMRTRFRRLVLLSPLLGFGDHGWPTTVIGPLAGALALFGFARTQVPGAARHVLYPRPFAGNRLSSDERRFARAAKLAEAHPELTVGAPTIGWIRAATDAMIRLDDIDFVDRIRIPTLIIAAGADKVVSNAATERFARTLKIGHMITIPGARHELLMESDIYREQTFAAFDAFIPGS